MQTSPITVPAHFARRDPEMAKALRLIRPDSDREFLVRVHLQMANEDRSGMCERDKRYGREWNDISCALADLIGY